MKTIVWLFVIGCLLCSCRGKDQPVSVDLPVTMVTDYGPFDPGFSVLGNEHKHDEFWGKMRLPVKGIPKNWSNVDKAMVWLNTHQLIYQHFITGNFTQAQLDHLKEAWKWLPDTTKLSAKPIKCYVYTARGFDEVADKWAVMIDTNNNLDFSDETAFYPIAIDGKNPFADASPKLVHYEIYRQGKVVSTTVPMVVKMMGREFLYNFQQHAQATLHRNRKSYRIAIDAGFTNPDFEKSSLIEAATVGRGKRVTDDQLTGLGEIITLGGVDYKNKGVDTYTNTLHLDPVEKAEAEYSLQVGHRFRPFKGEEFTTKRPITFADYKGKYVYVDFWGTWCKGCVEDMPSLTELYAGLDKSRFEFIGIAADSPGKLAAFIEKRQISWPQIISDKQNNLVDQYGITGFPTSVLIDPNGVVIDRNIRQETLAAKLNELSK